jgi:hypothetical protein
MALNEIEFLKTEIENLRDEMTRAVSEGNLTEEHMNELSSMLRETFEDFKKERKHE